MTVELISQAAHGAYDTSAREGEFGWDVRCALGSFDLIDSKLEVAWNMSLDDGVMIAATLDRFTLLNFSMDGGCATAFAVETTPIETTGGNIITMVTDVDVSMIRSACTNSVEQKMNCFVDMELNTSSECMTSRQGPPFYSLSNPSRQGPPLPAPHSTP